MTNPTCSLLLVCLLSGCALTNTRNAGVLPDATGDAPVVSEVVPGIPDTAQVCELPRSGLRRICAYLDERADGMAGYTSPDCIVVGEGSVRSIEECVERLWTACEVHGSNFCLLNVGAQARCSGARNEACVRGDTDELRGERRYYCARPNPLGCTIDRSGAYREP